MSMDFDIKGIVDDLGESFTLSGVSRTFNDRGDATEAYTAYAMNGVVQVMTGDEEEVKEGIVDKEDIVIFIDENETNITSIKKDDYITISTLVSGIFLIDTIIHNSGHYELYAKRVMKT